MSLKLVASKSYMRLFIYALFSEVDILCQAVELFQ